MDSDALLEGIEAAGHRARLTRGLLAACFVAGVADVAVDVSMIDFLGRVAHGLKVTVEEGQHIDGLVLLVAIVLGIARLASVIMCMCWVHRACANLRLAGSGASRFSPGWSVGWWFVPFFNLVRVPQVMNDLEGRSADRNVDPQRQPTSSTLIGAWWTLVVVASIGSTIATKAVAAAKELATMREAYNSTLIADVLLVSSTVLTWFVLRRIDRLQREVLITARRTPTVAPAA